jgi:hypothetical protein
MGSRGELSNDLSDVSSKCGMVFPTRDPVDQTLVRHAISVYAHQLPEH